MPQVHHNKVNQAHAATQHDNFATSGTVVSLLRLRKITSHKFVPLKNKLGDEEILSLGSSLQ